MLLNVTLVCVFHPTSSCLFYIMISMQTLNTDGLLHDILGDMQDDGGLHRVALDYLM